MRDLLFKNLTYVNRGRKIIASSEVSDKEGVHSIVRRHFAYIVKPVKGADENTPKPYLYILKERNSKQKREHFFCKMKGSILALNQGKLLQISFLHTLNVQLTASEKLSEQIN